MSHYITLEILNLDVYLGLCYCGILSLTVKEVRRRKSINKEVLRTWRELLAEKRNRLVIIIIITIIIKTDYGRRTRSIHLKMPVAF
jgi:hypothetical protein